MMRRLQRFAGGLWALLAIGVWVKEIHEQFESEFILSASYYAVVWGTYLFAFVGGAAVALGYPAGRWAIVLTATLVTMQQLWVALAYGIDSPALWPEAITIIAFAVGISVIVLWRQPNITVDPDARKVSARGSP